MAIIAFQEFHNGFLKTLKCLYVNASKKQKKMIIDSFSKREQKIRENSPNTFNEELKKLNTKKLDKLNKIDEKIERRDEIYSIDNTLKKENKMFFELLSANKIKEFCEKLYDKIDEYIPREDLIDEESKKDVQRILESYWLLVKYGFPELAKKIHSELKDFEHENKKVFEPFMSNIHEPTPPKVSLSDNTSAKKTATPTQTIFDATKRVMSQAADKEKWFAIGGSESSQVTYCHADDPLNRGITVSTAKADLHEPRFGDTLLAVEAFFETRKAQGMPVTSIKSTSDSALHQMEAIAATIELGGRGIKLYHLNGSDWDIDEIYKAFNELTFANLPPSDKAQFDSEEAFVEKMKDIEAVYQVTLFDDKFPKPFQLNKVQSQTSSAQQHTAT